MYRWCAFLAGCLLSATTVCVADELISKPDVRPGDRWVYNRMEYWTSTTEFVYEIETSFANNRVIITTLKYLKDNRVASNVNRSGRGEIADTQWTAEWNAMSDIEGAVISPHTGLLKFPLAVGDRHQSNYTIKADQSIGFSTKHERTIKVVGWEDVVVPAGRFRTLRIEAQGLGTNVTTGRSGIAR